MKDVQKTIQKFINIMGYYNNPNIEGIIFYGSYQTGFNNAQSDIDLHIIFNDQLKEEIRGSMLVDNIRIEYFEKAIKSMYKRTIDDFKHQKNTTVSMIVHGNILFDKNGNIAKLQQYIKNIYSMPIPGLDFETAKQEIAIINNYIDDLNYLVDTNNTYMNHVFHLTLERIKEFYFCFNGLPGISKTKLMKVIENDAYCKAIYKQQPDEYFTKIYLQCLDENISIKDRLPILIDLHNYVTRNINFNGHTHRIILK